MKFYSIRYRDVDGIREKVHTHTAETAMKIAKELLEDASVERGTIQVCQHKFPTKVNLILKALDAACNLGTTGPIAYPGETKVYWEEEKSS